jgi:carbon storage regulator CsrA
MLVLSRRKDERITIDTRDGPIEILIVQVRTGGVVKLGITAPNDCEIVRNELLLKPDGKPVARDGGATDGLVSTVAEEVPACS